METLPHKLYGIAAITPKALDNPPRETSFLKDIKPRKDIIIFPHAKTNDFKLHLPSKQNTSHTFQTGSGTFYNHPEPMHPPPTYRRPESFYSTSVATAPSPIPEERNLTRSRNLDSVRVNLSNSPEERSVNNKLKRQPSTTSLGDNKERNAFANLPAALEPEPVRAFDSIAMKPFVASTQSRALDSDRVPVPQTATPIVISQEVCRSVNIKSRMEGQLEHKRDMSFRSMDENQHTTTSKETEDSQDKVFESLPLTKANVSKQSDDVVLTHTPENTLDVEVRSPLTNFVTNDDVSLPVSRQDSSFHNTSMNDTSLATSTPLPTITDEQAAANNQTQVENKNDQGGNEQHNTRLELDIDLI